MHKWISVFVFIFSAIQVLGQHQVKGLQYISPAPESKMHMPETNVILRHGDRIDEAVIQQDNLFLISGSQSGEMEYTTTLSIDQKTITIQPSIPFQYGEEVLVEVMQAIPTATGSTIETIDFRFFITTTQLEEEVDFYETRTPGIPSANHRGGVPPGFPSFTINANNSPEPGYLVFANKSGFPSNNDRFMTIMDNVGIPVMAIQNNDDGEAFTINRNGYFTYFDPVEFQYYMMDSSYAIIDSFSAGNGYDADNHEFQILPTGHHWLLIHDKQTVDMSVIWPGGDPNALVTGLVIQELDPSKNVIFQWRSWDHFQITDINDTTGLTGAGINYCHGNALEVDTDGNIMISSRNMDEITKIDVSTGNIIWRMGGKNNQFTFPNDADQFCYQHDIRRIANGNVTLFANGNCYTPPISRAKEYQLDEVNKIATLVWSYSHPTNLYARAMGNVQRLPGGQTHINWGMVFGEPAITEVTPDSIITYEITFDDITHRMYRSYRFPWDLSANTIEENNSVFGLTNFPNPATNYTNIYYQSSSNQSIAIELYDAKGAYVENIFNGDAPQGNNHIRYSTSHLQNGLYFYTLNTTSGSASGKLVILK
jgi:hypothetical protein